MAAAAVPRDLVAFNGTATACERGAAWQESLAVLESMGSHMIRKELKELRRSYL